MLLTVFFASAVLAMPTWPHVLHVSADTHCTYSVAHQMVTTDLEPLCVSSEGGHYACPLAIVQACISIHMLTSAPFKYLYTLCA